MVLYHGKNTAPKYHGSFTMVFFEEGLLLQKPKIRRIGARFENVLFKKGTYQRGGCPDTLDTSPGSAPDKDGYTLGTTTILERT